MRQRIRTIAAAVAAAVALPHVALAGASAKPFVAPGLWEIVSEVHGPMQQQSRLTQQQCWNAQGESGQQLGMPVTPAQGRLTAITHSVVNTDQHSTIHLRSAAQFPQGAMTQDITMVFTAHGTLHPATMTGHGSMTFTSNPALDETFTQHGHWVAAVCPSVLSPAKTVELQSASMPALAALQNLARKLQAQDPHPNGP